MKNKKCNCLHLSSFAGLFYFFSALKREFLNYLFVFDKLLLGGYLRFCLLVSIRFSVTDWREWMKNACGKYYTLQSRTHLAQTRSEHYYSNLMLAADLLFVFDTDSLGDYQSAYNLLSNKLWSDCILKS